MTVLDTCGHECEKKKQCSHVNLCYVETILFQNKINSYGVTITIKETDGCSISYILIVK